MVWQLTDQRWNDMAAICKNVSDIDGGASRGPANHLRKRNCPAQRGGISMWTRGRVRWGYKRPTRIGIVERVAEYWACKRFGWSADIFKGTLVKSSNGGSDAYRILKPVALLRLNPKFESLRIAEWTRFGNSVFQLRNFFYMGEMLKVRTLEFAEPHAFFAGARVGTFELKWNMAGQLPSVGSIEGLFFFLDAFRVSVDEDASARIFTEYLRPLLVPELREPEVPRGNALSCCHIPQTN